MNRPQLTTGALLALAAVAANGASFDLTSGQFSANVDKTTSAEFSDVYNFSFEGLSGFVSGSLAEYKLSNAIDIDWGDVPALEIHAGWDGTGAVLASFADPMQPASAFSIQDLAVPNHFSITINGRAIGTGLGSFQPGVRGSYDLSIAAQPVPEPKSLALMLAGLGVIGFLGARRRAER